MKSATVKLPIGSPVTITLKPDNAAALKDFTMWTGVTITDAINRAVAEFMYPGGGEQLMWDVARDPAKRAAAFAKAGLSPEKIASWTRGIEAQLTKERKGKAA